MNTIEIDAQIDCVMDHIVALNEMIQALAPVEKSEEMGKKSYLRMSKELHLSIVRHVDRMDAIKRLETDDIL